MKILSQRLAAATLLAMALSPAARADAVTDWNTTALAVTDPLPPQAESRVLSMVHGAQFDAVNAVTRSHAPYLIQPAAAADTSADAAAASAAHAVLMALAPGQKAMLDAALASSLAKVTDAAARDRGVALGRDVASKYLAERESDGSQRPAGYTPGSAPGQWRPTAPAQLPFTSVLWADVKPWVLKSGAEVGAPGPLAIDSAQYAREIDEVRRVGARDSKERSADQTAAALFSSIKTGVLWNAAARAAVAASGNRLIDNARLFALMNMAGQDAVIAGWVVKRQYALWRPITAIRTSGRATDAAWEPLLNTPPHPDYVSGHCIVSGANAEALRRLLKSDGVPFSATFGPTATGQTRSFGGITQAEVEINNARVWAGIHTRTADDHGTQMGHQIAALVVERAMRPLN